MKRKILKSWWIVILINFIIFISPLVGIYIAAPFQVDIIKLLLVRKEIMLLPLPTDIFGMHKEYNKKKLIYSCPMNVRKLFKFKF